MWVTDRFPLLSLTDIVTTQPEVPTSLIPKQISFSEKFPDQNAVDRIAYVLVSLILLTRPINSNVHFTNWKVSPDIEDSCKYSEWTVTRSRRRKVLRTVLHEGLVAAQRKMFCFRSHLKNKFKRCGHRWRSRIVTCKRLDDSGFEPRWGRDQPWYQSNLLGQWVPGLFHGGKAAGVWNWPSSPSSAGVKRG
jgi:hypothetical protein